MRGNFLYINLNFVLAMIESNKQDFSALKNDPSKNQTKQHQKHPKSNKKAPKAQQTQPAQTSQLINLR